MTRRLGLVLCTVLLILPLMGTTSYAGEKPIYMKFAGTVADTSFDVIGPDGFVAALVETDAKGSFGARSLSVLTEFVPTGSLCDNNENVIYLSIGYGEAVTTFAKADQLLGSTHGGFMCLNVITGDFYGETEGMWDGGTGRFAHATGPFFVRFSGKNMTASKLGVGFGAIHGKVKGRIKLH
ncbi:MAG: hypothetical protein KJP08_06310 [Gammaproteobacteria bacterium]|nr:hypothetical protein [Gammaproteobacteria bacterium]MBT8094403.1 hypothetical protein [Gammaproteobacteria bacterium]MBT8104742.1 hypothetical protein [Gammaproteobacteria bacterium]NNF50400.1 hypothetical protein [Woeseiaceae bacterium]NNK24756.1 hypothetical protein [Woeseiaceae bacterium]